MLWRTPEMVAPRALVFRPLVKGDEALGTRFEWTWVRLVFSAIVLRASIGLLHFGLPSDCNRTSTEILSELTSDSRRTSFCRYRRINLEY